ncbi:MAG: Flp family type IVb pilin [Gemmataceae bacterium]
MRTFINPVLNLLREEDGPTAVEYAVMLALIIMVCFGAIALIGEGTAENFEANSNAIVKALGGS